MAEETKENTAPEAEVKEEATAPAVEEKKEKKEEKKDVEVPSKFKKLVEEVENMTVLELHELVKVLEEKFEVSAQAVAVAAPGAAAGGDAGEEQDSFTVELKTVGDQKIAIIKVIKEVLGLGLKEAKDMSDSAPTVIKEGIKKDEAEEIKKKIEEAGGTAELK